MSYFAFGRDSGGQVSIQSSLEQRAEDVTSLDVSLGRGVLFGTVFGIALWASLAQLIRLL